MTTKWIAEENVVFVHPDGSRRPGVIAIGLPFVREDGEARCAISLSGYERGTEIAGASELQALLLAIRFAALRLADFVRRGGRVLYPDGDAETSGEEVPLETFFGALFARRP